MSVRRGDEKNRRVTFCPPGEMLGVLELVDESADGVLDDVGSDLADGDAAFVEEIGGDGGRGDGGIVEELAHG